MNPETIGLISGVLVTISAIPYIIRTGQKKIHPNLTSWFLWTLIGLELLLTYKSSGAEANIWPAVFGFTNPLIIMLIVLKQHGGWKKPDKVEVFCLIFGLLSLGLWLFVHDNKNLAQYALYLAIIADACAAIPTIIFVWTHPDGDRPFAWAFFAIGYALVIFAITEHTFANYALPVYMSLVSLTVALPLTIYRWRNKVYWTEWI